MAIQGRQLMVLKCILLFGLQVWFQIFLNGSLWYDIGIFFLHTKYLQNLSFSPHFWQICASSLHSIIKLKTCNHTCNMGLKLIPLFRARQLTFLQTSSSQNILLRLEKATYPWYRSKSLCYIWSEQYSFIRAMFNSFCWKYWRKFECFQRNCD